jgi:predicted site-specific integrase-resolvase
MRIGLYARVSTEDQNTLPMQIQALQKYVASRNWAVALQIEDIGSGAKERPKRDELLPLIHYILYPIAFSLEVTICDLKAHRSRFVSYPAL